jgi:hypothetical protein
MTGLTDYAAQATLNYWTGKSAMPALPTVYLGLFTTAPSDAGGGVEVAGGSYARKQTAAADWNAASGSAPSLASNANSLAFPIATANWGTIVAFGAFDANAAGNLLWWAYLGNYLWLPFSASLASPAVLTSPAHGYSNGDQVVVSTEYGGALPTTGGSWSGLLTVAGATTDTFNVGVNSTSSGSGLVRKVTPQSVPSGVQASFSGGAPGQLVLSLA